MKHSSLYDHIVDVTEELVKYIILLRANNKQIFLAQRVARCVISLRQYWGRVGINTIYYVHSLYLNSSGPSNNTLINFSIFSALCTHSILRLYVDSICCGHA